LHKENIISSYTFEERRLKFSVAETLDIDLSDMSTKTLGDLFGKLLGTGAGEDLG
jgi:hypothetical protein